MVEKKIDQLNKEGQELRASALAPVFAMLTKLKLEANDITALRMITLPVYLYFIADQPDIAVSALLIGTFLDWFDGGLARYQNKASDRGKFWDVLADHTIYVVGVFGLFFLQTISPIVLGYQLLIVPILYLLATIVASESMKTDWIIHPYYRIVYLKPFGLLAIVLYAYWGIDYIEETIYLANIVMSALTLYYIWVLHKRWKIHE
jgi:phosphatidylglycerophosphate synthase